MLEVLEALLLLIMAVIPFISMVFTMFSAMMLKHSPFKIFASIASVAVPALANGALAISLVIVLFNQFGSVSFVLELTISTCIVTISYLSAQRIISPLANLLEAGRVSTDKDK